MKIRQHHFKERPIINGMKLYYSMHRRMRGFVFHGWESQKHWEEQASKEILSRENPGGSVILEIGRCEGKDCVENNVREMKYSYRPQDYDVIGGKAY